MQDLIKTLRAAIKRDERTLYRIAKDAEMPYSGLHRFVRAERTAINLVTAARLCKTLGLELKPARRVRKG